MTTTLLSVSTTPNGSPFSPRPNIIIIPSTVTFIRTIPSSSKLIPLCSPSSSTSIAEQSTPPPPPPPPPPSDAELPDQPKSPPTTTNSTNSSLRGCKGCGREEIERGCNGEGRIQGGIATVPGFGWWPIKAYRPCPGFVASGGRYRRQGQSMDEVAFGRIVERQTTTSIIATDDTTEESQSSKKKQSSKKLRK